MDWREHDALRSGQGDKETRLSPIEIPQEADDVKGRVWFGEKRLVAESFGQPGNENKYCHCNPDVHPEKFWEKGRAA